MAWALVKWIAENRMSIVPSAWVVEPTPLPSIIDDDCGFPVDGKCYWRKKSSGILDIVLLAVSDKKNDLEKKMNEFMPPDDAVDSDDADNDTETVSSNDGKAMKRHRNDRGIDSDAAAAEESNSKKLRRNMIEEKEIKRKNREDKKLQKLAEIKAADEMAEEIFKTTSDCWNCSNKERKLKETEGKFELQRRECKMLRDNIDDLEEKLKSEKKIRFELEQELQQRNNTSISTNSGIPPHATTENKLFLEQLCQFYSANKLPSAPQVVVEDKDDVYSDMELADYEEVSSEAVTTNGLSDYELQREKNIERNKELLKSVGIEQIDKKATVTPKRPVDVSKSLKLKSATIKGYSYDITPADLQSEQQAFEPGEGKKELVSGFGVYIKYVDLEQAEQTSKSSATGLMRALISVFYSKERLAASSANSGINSTIRTAIFKYCEKYPNSSPERLKRDLTSKCGEERRKLTKK